MILHPCLCLDELSAFGIALAKLLEGKAAVTQDLPCYVPGSVDL